MGKTGNAVPKPVDPRLGQDGYETDPLVSEIDAADLARVCAVLDVFPRKSYERRLRNRLSEIQDTYWQLKGRGSAAFTRAEARKALEIAFTIEPLTCEVVSSLNGRALELVFDELYQMTWPLDFQKTSLQKELSEGRLRSTDLKCAVDQALKKLVGRKGPDKNRELRVCIPHLLWVYEDITREPATFSCNRGRLYSQEPVSKAGRFVRACFRAIDPDVQPYAINAVVREAMDTARLRREHHRKQRLARSTKKARVKPAGP